MTTKPTLTLSASATATDVPRPTPTGPVPPTTVPPTTVPPTTVRPTTVAPTPATSPPRTPPPTVGNTPSTTVWYTSAVAQAAARRMAAAGRVGDPVCSMAALGNPDPRLVPQVSRIGIGTSQGYWCLIW
ncbi:hypothetical protein ACGGAI_06990 [Streptomyces antibioticus]|uniref:hypothetical protein n=1 Tax=Streptomyces antibioticus TaxID=1890 RepID=UPI00372064A8